MLQAVFATFAVFAGALFLYGSRIVKVTKKFVAVVMMATLGILLTYVAAIVLGLFGIELGFINDPSPLGIGVSVVHLHRRRAEPVRRLLLHRGRREGRRADVHVVVLRVRPDRDLDLALPRDPAAAREGAQLTVVRRVVALALLTAALAVVGLARARRGARVRVAHLADRTRHPRSHDRAVVATGLPRRLRRPAPRAHDLLGVRPRGAHRAHGRASLVRRRHRAGLPQALRRSVPDQTHAARRPLRRRRHALDEGEQHLGVQLPVAGRRLLPMVAARVRAGARPEPGAESVRVERRRLAAGRRGATSIGRTVAAAWCIIATACGGRSMRWGGNGAATGRPRRTTSTSRSTDGSPVRLDVDSSHRS